jgi:hypothetical protein
METFVCNNPFELLADYMNAAQSSLQQFSIAADFINAMQRVFANSIKLCFVLNTKQALYSNYFSSIAIAALP